MAATPEALPGYDTDLQITELIELTHPGAILREDFLEPMGFSAYQLSKAVGVQQTRISEIIRGRQRVPAKR